MEAEIVCSRCEEEFDSKKEKRQHWEYKHAGQESDNSLPKPEVNRNSDGNLVRDYRRVKKRKESC